MATLLQDIRFGTRMLLKKPAMTFLAAFTLALGIGANTTIFSAVNGLLLRPLPVANADRLTVVTEESKALPGSGQISYLDYKDMREQTNAFSDLLAYNLNLVGLDADGKADPIVVSYVSSNYFSALGLKPVAGNLIYGDQVEKQGTAPVIVLGYDYWKSRFNGDPAVIGRQVKLNGTMATVIGVAPQGFHGLYSLVEMQAYLPMGMRTLWSESSDFWTKRDSRQVKVLGVLKPGTNRTEALSSLDVVMQRLKQSYPEDKDYTAHIYPERLARPEPDPDQSLVVIGILFMALAGLVLLLACTNVANIVLVRAAGRGREMAIRSALGAARTRLLRQLMTESLLLGLLGGAAGLLIGLWGERLLSSIRLYAFGHPLLFDFSFDWRVFTFGLAAAILTGILVGFAPALRVMRADLNKVLHEGSRGILAGTGRSHFRNSLVVLQVGFSLVLLVVAGLFVRSARNAERMYFGFDPRHVLNLTMDIRNAGFDRARAQQFFHDLEEKARTLPGVESASLASSIPMGYSNDADPIYVDGKTGDGKSAAPIVLYNSVTRDYFKTMRMPILRGREFTDQDTEKSPRVAIVNEAMAKKFWPNEDAIGKTFRVGGSSGKILQIVGISKQGKYTSPVDDAFTFYYVPEDQEQQLVLSLQLRTAGAPEALIPAAEDAIHSMAPGLPVFGVETMEQSLEGANGLFLFRMGTRFSGALGLLGLVLALVGVYGVISYAAAQRTHEIGVRMAMGANRRDILAMVLRQGAKLVGIGLALGLVITFAATRGIANMLVGIGPNDPLTLSAVAVLLAVVGLVASLIPALRAMKVDPMKALQYE